MTFVIPKPLQFESRDDMGATNDSDARVIRRLRQIEADPDGRSRASSKGRRSRPAPGPAALSVDPQVMIAFVVDAGSNAITFTESTGRIGFPGASVAWSTGAASLFLELLSRVPMNAANELGQLASAFMSKCDETEKHVAESRVTVDGALENEHKRIADLLLKKVEQPPKQSGESTGSTAAKAPTRESAGKALDRFDVLVGDLGDLADRLVTRMTELEHWWKLAEVGRAAHETIERSTVAVDGVVAKLSRPLVDLRASVDNLCSVLGKTVRKRAERSVATDPTEPAEPPPAPAVLVRAAVDEQAEPLSGAVLDFLNLPRKEAWAYFKRMLDNVGTHPLLSIGALGGLVGLFAYAKALKELDRLGLSPIGLITSGDITDFALRLAPAFLLSCVAAISIVAFWVVALACNQRKAWSFAGALAGCGGLVLLVYKWLVEWTPPPDYLQADSLGIVLGSASLVVLVPVAMLFWAGRKRGVRDDDVWQQRILKALGMLSDGRGLLLLFTALGLALLGTERFSVLFAKGFSRLAQGQPLVLETKLFQDPILIYSSFSRLSSVWIIRRYDVATPDADSAAAPWSIVASSEVACVRTRTKSEQESQTLTNSCTNPRPATAFMPDTIAGYATALYRCERPSFSDQRRIAVMRFATNAPESDAAIDDAIVAGPLLQSTAEKLAVPGLMGLLAAEQREPVDIVDALRSNPDTHMVVLGFASTTGRSANNADLSQRRALALKRSLVAAAGITDVATAGLEDRIRYRGLGDGLLSGLFGVQGAIRDQVAVAFLCDRHPAVSLARQMPSL
jgi:hypothetical protein